jgi:hypothetical protein
MKVRSIVVFAIVCASCAHASLNRSQSRGPHAEGVAVGDVPVRGYPISVDATGGSESGELIAIDDEFVYVNTAEGLLWNVIRIPRATIKEVTVEVDSSMSTGTSVWTAIGCASTVSHGAYLVLTGPLWLAAGIPASISESTNAQAIAGHDELSSLYQYARFPQGLPVTLGGKPHRRVEAVADGGAAQAADAATPDAQGD